MWPLFPRAAPVSARHGGSSWRSCADMTPQGIVAIDIDGETVNVATAANLAMVTAYVLYAKDVFSKLSKLVLSKTSGTPEQTGGTTPPALEEPADAAEATAAE